MERHIPVGVLGATGVIGQQYIALLKDHPHFRLTEDLASCELLFSALPNAAAAVEEPKYAAKGATIISSASYHRLNPDIPLIIPEVNPDHLKLQSRIIAKPNCSIQSYVIPLTPLLHRFGIKEILVTTLQAISGAGKSGLSAYEIFDNVIPFIKDEEEKSEMEPLKIWGTIQDGKILLDTAIKISAQCNRVPVLHGHLASVSVRFHEKPSYEQIRELWEMQPSVTYNEHLEIRRDRDRDNGMGITVGRLRPCPVLDWRFVGLSHNAIRGGAGGGLLIAERLYEHAKKESFVQYL